jgi:hypothetical protein
VIPTKSVRLRPNCVVALVKPVPEFVSKVNARVKVVALAGVDDEGCPLPSSRSSKGLVI